jgi:hypothetical protein
LLEKALALPLAQPEDFFGQNRYPHDADPQMIRVINDTSLRTRLIQAGYAEGLQSPKGPQAIKSIIRVYPQKNAPPTKPRAALGKTGAHPPAAIRRATDIQPRSAYGLPSVEELQALIARIEAVEADVTEETQARLQSRVNQLKAEIPTLDGDALDQAVEALKEAVSDLKAAATGIREEAFRRIEADASFAPRVYLRLLSRQARG